VTRRALTPASGDEPLKEALRRAQLKPTVQMVATLRVLARAEGEWLGGEDIYRQLMMSGQPVSLATIYRVVKKLVSCGIVVRMWQEQYGSRRALYCQRANEPAPAGLPPGGLRIRDSDANVWIPVGDKNKCEILLDALRQCGISPGHRCEIEIDGMPDLHPAKHEEPQC